MSKNEVAYYGRNFKIFILSVILQLNFLIGVIFCDFLHRGVFDVEKLESAIHFFAKTREVGQRDLI